MRQRRLHQLIKEQRRAQAHIRPRRAVDRVNLLGCPDEVIGRGEGRGGGIVRWVLGVLDCGRMEI